MLIVRSVILLFSLLVFSTISSFAQDRLPLGTWRSHLTGNSSTTLALAGTTMYSGNLNSLFSYDTLSRIVKKISKIDGLAQSTVSKIGYSEVTKTLVIGYTNSQIDLIKDNTIFTVNDIFNANISGSKTINHLYFNGAHVCISTDFGLVIYNLEKREVTEVYSNFNSSNAQIQVFSSCFYQDSVIAATSAGLFKASNGNSVNKLDYRNWVAMYPPYITTSNPIMHIAPYNGSLFATAYYYLIKYKNGVWESPDITSQLPNQNFLNLSVSNNKLWFLIPYGIYYYDSTTIGYLKNSEVFSQPMDIIQTTQNDVWVSDKGAGLMTNKYDTSFTLIESNGPIQNGAFSLQSYNDKVVMTAGGYNDQFVMSLNPGRFSVFENGLWKNYSYQNKNTPKWEDVVSCAYNPISKKVYFGSYGWGIMEWDQDTVFTLINNKTPGCPLNTCNLGDDCFEDYPNPTGGGNYCRVMDVTVDQSGKVWVVNQQDNYNSDTPGVIFSYDLDKTWKAYKWSGTDVWNSTNYTSDGNVQYPRKIIVDKNNTKWITSRYLGLMAFNEAISPLPRYLQYVKYKINEICGTTVYDVAEDLDGAIWIGTENGICYFSDPTQVFQKTKITASLPVYENRALLNGTQVNAIEIDGGNRKWVGTNNSGAWLFSSDGTSKILHFNQSNSPLPSDLILDIKINNSTGEVFFSTDQGIYSYQGDAIAGEESKGAVFAYPNPVTQDFTGALAISGLVNNAIVKITDISGQLVYQTKAQGSLASWNIKDYTGRRAQPGIYLVFASKEDGSEAVVTKIAIIE